MKKIWGIWSGVLLALTFGMFISCSETDGGSGGGGGDKDGGSNSSKVWDGTADTTWYDVLRNEFTITTAEELAGLARLVNSGKSMYGKTIKLGKNIMLNDTTNWRNWENNPPENIWIPIGAGTGSYNSIFQGIFDGSEYVVSGVYINNSNDYQGFFYVAIEKASIKNCGIVASVIKGRDNVGGLIGQFGADFGTGPSGGTIENCYFKGIVIGRDRVGGLVGGNFRGGILYCYAEGNVRGSNSVGGLVGSATGGYINRSYAAGNVTGTFNIGGLVGRNAASEATFSSSVDPKNSGNIVNCYATGNVTGTSNVGGLVGRNAGYVYNRNRAGEIGMTYAIGKVTISDNNGSSGGLVGVNFQYSGTSGIQPAYISDSYYNLETTLQSDVGKGHGITTAQMKNHQSYPGSWGFGAVWGINSSINDGYPHLRVFQ